MTSPRIPRRSPEQCRQIVLSLIDDKGTKTETIHAALGFKCARNTLGVLGDMRQRGEICNAKAALDGATHADAYWFLTEAARDEFHAAYKVVWKQRRLAAQLVWRENEAKKRPPKVAKVKPPKPVREPKPAKAATVKTAKRLRLPPKPKTRRDNAIAEMLQRQRAAEKPAQRAGVAHLPGPADLSQAKITKVEPPKPRFWVDPETMPRFFSAVPPGREQLPPSSCAAGARHQLEMAPV